MQRMSTWLERVKILLVEYKGVTADVCKHVCLELEPTCESINYHRRRRSCQLSVIGHELTVVKLQKNPNVDYYRRQHCEGKKLKFDCHNL